MQPEHIKHRGRVAGWRHGEKFDGPYFAVYGNGGGKGTLDEWRTAMDMPWAQTKLEIAEAIPPAYTEYLGHQMIDYLTGNGKASA
jgi:DNA (cytosine-5)-methyltransferase 1